MGLLAETQCGQGPRLRKRHLALCMEVRYWRKSSPAKHQGGGWDGMNFVSVSAVAFLAMWAANSWRVPGSGRVRWDEEMTGTSVW